MQLFVFGLVKYPFLVLLFIHRQTLLVRSDKERGRYKHRVELRTLLHLARSDGKRHHEIPRANFGNHQTRQNQKEVEELSSSDEFNRLDYRLQSSIPRAMWNG